MRPTKYDIVDIRGPHPASGLRGMVAMVLSKGVLVTFAEEPGKSLFPDGTNCLFEHVFVVPALTDETETLKKIIEKALIGEWRAPQIEKAKKGNEPVSSVDFSLSNPQHRDLLIGQLINEPRIVVFHHEFVKAFWGEEQITMKYADDTYEPPYGNHKEFGGTLSYSYDEGGNITWEGPAWKYHVQKMALEANPIDYLRKFI